MIFITGIIVIAVIWILASARGLFKDGGSCCSGNCNQGRTCNCKDKICEDE